MCRCDEVVYVAHALCTVFQELSRLPNETVQDQSPANHPEERYMRSSLHNRRLYEGPFLAGDLDDSTFDDDEEYPPELVDACLKRGGVHQ